MFKQMISFFIRIIAQNLYKKFVLKLADVMVMMYVEEHD